MSVELKVALINFVKGVWVASEGDLSVCKHAKRLIEALNAEPTEPRKEKIE